MKKTSSVLKQEAKSTLKGRWKDAVLLDLIPNLLKILSVWLVVLVFGVLAAVVGYTVSTSSDQGRYEQSINSDRDVFDQLEDVDDDSIYQDDEYYINDNGLDDVTNNVGVMPSVTSGLFSIFLSFITLGISFTFLDLVRNPKRKVSPLKDAFRLFNGKDFVPVFLVGLIQRVFIWLWTLLLVVPGIIKSYSYSQAFYIYKDLSAGNDVQGLSALNYISESRKIMDGNKGRLFYIDLSFIGWHILAMMTLGLGYLFLNPYIETTKAAFYRDITEDRYLPLVDVEPVIDVESVIEA